MPISINGSGSITGLSAGGLPDASITQADLASGVAGNGPAFSAYLGTNQTLSSSTWTKLQINTEEFDTNSNYDPTTNYRFTPTVAGYYQFSAGVFAGNGNNTALEAALYKNGSGAKYAYNYSATSATLDDWGVNFSALIYMNGSTDYVELYGFAVGNTRVINSDAGNTWFSGVLVRGA